MNLNKLEQRIFKKFIKSFIEKEILQKLIKKYKMKNIYIHL